MSGLRHRAESGAATLLKRGVNAGKSIIPARNGPAGVLLRPLAAGVAGVIGSLERSGLRHEEERLRGQLQLDESDSEGWYQLGRTLVAAERYDEAIEPLLRSAETGTGLRAAVRAFINRDRLYELVSAPQYLDRMRALARAKPDAVGVQLLVGAFFLDQGLLEEGRTQLHRAYRLRFENNEPDALAAMTPDGISMTPSYLILGPHKSGTTALHALLNDHPDVLTSPRKELQFWQNRHDRPLEVYDAYFPPVEESSRFIAGEASPTNLQLPEAAHDVKERYPLVKTIVLRRDPVARAYSHFQMLKRLGAEPREFEQAMQAELRAFGPAPPLVLEDIGGAHAPYLLGSCILPYLRCWIDALGPERVMVIDSAALSSERHQTLEAVHGYLGLPPAPLVDAEDRNVGSYLPIGAEIADELEAWFAPHERALEALLAEHPARVSAEPSS